MTRLSGFHDMRCICSAWRFVHRGMEAASQIGQLPWAPVIWRIRQCGNGMWIVCDAVRVIWLSAVRLAQRAPGF